MSFPWERLLAFMVLFGAMYGALTQVWSEGVSHWVIDVATVKPAAWIARQWNGETAIVADGSHIRSPEASINVLFGCEGTDVLMLMLAALLVTPVPWRDRLIGMAVGIGFLFAINQIRVLALFYAMRQHRSWFGPMHGLITPLLVVAGVGAFYFAWLRWAGRRVPIDDASAA